MCWDKTKACVYENFLNLNKYIRKEKRAEKIKKLEK